MALLENCFCCSLAVASSVIGVYTLVAYIIAFSMEIWWIVHTDAILPSPAYILCAGYFMVFLFSGVLLRGLSVKRTLYLLEWLLVIAAFSFPEALLVLFMSIHYWKVRSLYGLTELTCWVCRAVVNVAGMICVQSLYSTWREEKQVLRRLRDLNMASVLPPRRGSLASNGHVKNGLAYQNVGFSASTNQLNNGAIVPNLRRSASTILPRTGSQESIPLSVQPHSMFPFFYDNGFLDLPFKNSEFNASTFDLALASNLRNNNITRAQSMLELHNFGSTTDLPRKAMSVIDYSPSEKLEAKTYTQSLDRRVLKPIQNIDRSKSMSDISYFAAGDGRIRNAYFSPDIRRDFMFDPRRIQFVPHPAFYYGRNINTFYPGKPKTRSKNSLGEESDDFQKYRDVAL